MRRFATITLFGLLTAACAAAPGADGTADVVPIPAQFQGTGTTLPAASDAAPEPVVLGEIPSSSLTDGAITVEALALMPLRELGAPFEGFVAVSEGEESNEAATDELANPADEAADIEQFGRSTGYRVSLEPTRLSDSGARFVDNWVELFTTARGASQYLADYMGDLSKGIDAAHDPDLNATSSRSFAVDDLGDEASGITLIETAADGEPYVETVVGMRIGRLLAFVSIGRASDIDVRVIALDLGRRFEERITGVLDGSLVPVVATDPPAVLETYAFEYQQRLEQAFRIVESAVQDDGIGGGDGEGGTEPEPGTEPGTEPPEPAPTTTITWTKEEVATTVTAKGIVTTDATRCELTIRNNGRRISRGTYIITFDKVWRSTNGRNFKEVDALEERYSADLLFCPGWYPSRSESGVRSITRPGRGTIEEAKDGTVTERYDLGLKDLVSAGLAGESGSGLRVNRFTLWTGGEGPWVVGVDLQVSGPTSAMERAFGPAFYPGGSVKIALEFSAHQLNDPDLVVEIPESDD
jgi:hypothetical protein